MSNSVTLERRGKVALITLNRPERLNAWSTDVNADFLECLAGAALDDRVKGVVITGAGRAFCAGADLKNTDTHSVSSAEAWLDEHRGQPVFDALESYDKPLVAAVNGFAVGIGCLMPLCCDFITINEHAVFCLPQVSLGILPAYGGTLRLARFVGRGAALDIALTGRRVKADEAMRIGISSRLYSAESLLDESIAIVQRIGEMPVHAVRLARESLRVGYESGMAATEAADNLRFMALAQTQDRAARHQGWRDTHSVPGRE